jgi:hypothetical protein
MTCKHGVNANLGDHIQNGISQGNCFIEYKAALQREWLAVMF